MPARDRRTQSGPPTTLDSIRPLAQPQRPCQACDLPPSSLGCSPEPVVDFPRRPLDLGTQSQLSATLPKYTASYPILQHASLISFDGLRVAGLGPGGRHRCTAAVLGYNVTGFLQ